MIIGWTFLVLGCWSERTYRSCCLQPQDMIGVGDWLSEVLKTCLKLLCGSTASARHLLQRASRFNFKRIGFEELACPPPKMFGKMIVLSKRWAKIYCSFLECKRYAKTVSFKDLKLFWIQRDDSFLYPSFWRFRG